MHACTTASEYGKIEDLLAPAYDLMKRFGSGRPASGLENVGRVTFGHG